ncbi:MAG TPA: glycosyltransferase family 39 protein [Vicinamibacterales bacterium]|nr:glycosyltransferase family 39 protein [Vicinamibacterales bacterium]
MVRSEGRQLYSVALIALAGVLLIKLAVFFEFAHHPLLLPGGQLDDAYYYHLADRIAAGDVWLADPATFGGRAAPPFFLSPLYLYVLAAILKVSGGSIQVVRIVQVTLGTAAVGLLWLTSRRWYGEAAAWWTAGFAALFGLAAFYEVLIVEAALDPVLTALDLFLLTRAIDRRTWPSWALAGAGLGLHALNRPNTLMVFAGLAAILVVIAAVRRAGVTAAVAFLVAGLLVLSPATWRNWRVSHQFVAVTSTTGLNVLIGNGPEADGTFVRVMGIEPSVDGQWLGAPLAVSKAVGHDVSAAEASRYLLRQSLAWARAHPGKELRLLSRKTYYALSNAFLTLSHSYPFFARDTAGALTLCIVGPALVVPLGLVGLILARPRESHGYWLWAAYVPLSLVSIVLFFVAARFRLPMQVALLVPAGGAAAWLAAQVRATRWSAVAWPAAAVAALAAVVAWPTGLDDGRAEEQVRLGLYDIRTGKVPEGETLVASALPRHADPAIVQLRVGQLYETMNRPSDAITHYEAGLKLDGSDLALHFAYGRALFAVGRDADALPELTRAQSGPQGDAATRVMVLALSRLGRRDEANQMVRTLDPARWNADQAREFAVGLASVGRVDLSVAAWRRAAEASGNARDYERLALTWVLLGRPADSIGPFEEAVKRDSTSATIRLNYAVALYSVGRKDDARRETEATLKLDPNYDKAKQFLQALGK